MSKFEIGDVCMYERDFWPGHRRQRPETFIVSGIASYEFDTGKTLRYSYIPLAPPEFVQEDTGPRSFHRTSPRATSKVIARLP